MRSWPPVIPACPKPLTELFTTIIEKISRSIPRDGINVRTEQGQGGININAYLGGTGGGGLADTAVVIVKQIEGEWKAGVIFDYFLAQQVIPASTPEEITVTGKLTSPSPTDEDSGWKDTFDNDYIWIEAPVVGLSVEESASVKSYGQGSEYGGGEIENNGSDDAPEQTKLRIVLAKIVDTGSGLIVQPRAGKSHRVGITYGDSAGADGGNVQTVYALAVTAL